MKDRASDKDITFLKLAVIYFLNRLPKLCRSSPQVVQIVSPNCANCLPKLCSIVSPNCALDIVPHLPQASSKVCIVALLGSSTRKTYIMPIRSSPAPLQLRYEKRIVIAIG